MYLSSPSLLLSKSLSSIHSPSRLNIIHSLALSQILYLYPTQNLYLNPSIYITSTPLDAPF